MNKIFCDRCGKEIKSHAAWLRHRVHYAETKLILCGRADDFWHDLCPNCEDSFTRWYNHPERDDNENA